MPAGSRAQGAQLPLPDGRNKLSNVVRLTDKCIGTTVARMRCSACGTELIAGKQFCHACGTAVASRCGHCGSALTIGFRFCPDCGTAVDGAAAPAEPPVSLPPPSEPPGEALRAEAATPVERAVPEPLAQKILATRGVVEGERKLVTVFFCDLAGSTAIAERLDPEEYRELLDQYVTLAFREIYRFEGMVNQLAGDGMMALFGAPVAHEDAPQRAVWAALAIHAALGRLNERLRHEHGPELHARIGIHTGPVVVGNVGNDLKMDYTAIGDTTNLASRLESLAAPGTVLVSEETFQLVRGFFEMKAAGPFQVKGKTSPVVAYEVLGERALAHPMEIAFERGLTPLVGREEELAQLEACYQRVKGHLPQVISIVGENGSGRSRLIYELKQRIAPEPTIFEARCAALSQRVAYYPWAAMLQTYFGLTADDNGECACVKVTEKIATLKLSDSRSASHLMRLLSLQGAGEDLPPEDVKRETFEAIGRILLEESQRAPVLVILEDVHWIDDASREMLERAVNELCRSRLMIVLTHRPEFRVPWQTEAAVTQLNLRRLTEEAASSIIRTVAGGDLPPDLERLILTKSEGSPFFTEEITRSLIEGGYLSRVDGHNQLTRSVDEVSIPGTVQEVIAARLDRLPPEAKRALQVAAVMGRQFSTEQLRQLLAAEEIDIDRVLDLLERRGIIHRKNLFSNDLYRFGESLTQEVAYEGLLLRQRRQLHERIGELIESTPGERTAERSALLAHHYTNSDNVERAATALLRAAHDAEKVPSYPAAARFYREAWELIRRERRTPDVALARQACEAALGLCRMSVIYGAFPGAEAEPVAAAAERLAQQLGSKELTLTLSGMRGMTMVSGPRGRFDEGLSLLEESLAAAELAGIRMPGMARGAAWAYVLDGRFELARRTIDGAVREMEQSPEYRNTDVYLGALYLRERINYFRDDFEAARRGALATHELGVKAANRTVQSGTAGTLAMIHFFRGEYAEARRWAERGGELAKVIGNRSARAAYSAIILSSRVALGDTRSLGRHAEALEGELAAEGELLLLSGLVVNALVVLGELDRAVDFAERVHGSASGRLRQATAAVALGEALRHHDHANSSRALAVYQAGADLAKVIGARSVQAQAHLGIAEILTARGEEAAAAPHLDAAATIVRDLGLSRYLPRLEELLSGGAGVELSV